MILVDSSVWIDYFRGVLSIETDQLDRLLWDGTVYVGDLILMEVLQGFHVEAQFEIARTSMLACEFVELCGIATALIGASNYRKLRNLGFTTRKSIDVIIATWCIENDCTLLHSDRDFDPFAAHLGLRTTKV